MKKRNLQSDRPHIRMQMIVKMSVANLRFKRFRSFVTILGVVIGIGSVYLLVSFGMGLQQLVQGEIVGSKSIDTVDITSINSSVIQLTDSKIDQIKAVPHVVDVSGSYMLASQVTLDGATADLVAYGVDSLYLRVSDLNLLAGRLIDPEKTDELIINNSLLEAVGVSNTDSAIGKVMEVKFTPQGGIAVDKKMTVVGVINSGTGSEIFISHNVFREANVAEFTQAKAVIENRESIPDARHSIESLGYTTTSPVDTLDQVNEVFKFFNLILIGLGSIGMVIAVLGIINTLTVSLLERTREIALMLAIGARPKDMRRLFTVEAILLSLTGGVIGIAIATVIGYVVDAILNQFASDRGISYHFSVFSTPPLLVLSMLVLMVLIGIAVSYVPARRAARINPIDGLHEE